MFESVGRDTKYKGGVSRDADNMFGSVHRDTQYRGGVGRDTDNLSRARGKVWIRLGNNGRELSSNLTSAHWNK
jgi:hypothetical protein